MISKFIKDCGFQEATIHFKENDNSPLYSVSGISDVSSSSQLVYLDIGHEDEYNNPINGEKLISLLENMDDHSCEISMLEGYYPNMENKVFEINHIRIDLLKNGSVQVHLASKLN